MSPGAARPHRFALLAAFLGCALIWGSTFLVIRIGNETVPPIWAGALRLMLAAPLLALLCRLTGHPLPRGAAFRAAAAYGFLNMGLSFTLLYWAETRVPSGLAAVFYATIPLSSTFLTRAFGLEQITPLKVGAATIALIGVAAIFSTQAQGRADFLPMAAILCAATLAALSTVLLKRGPRQNPWGANAVGAGAGLVVCLAASFLAGEPHTLPRTFAEVFPIVYLTLAGSIGAFVMMAWLVNHWDVTRISFVSVIVPVVALVLGALVRQERLEPAGFVGSALVLAGVLLRMRADRVEGSRKHG
jgi:drug/metabolite transporter (DMT)-like permease